LGSGFRWSDEITRPFKVLFPPAGPFSAPRQEAYVMNQAEKIIAEWIPTKVHFGEGSIVVDPEANERAVTGRKLLFEALL